MDMENILFAKKIAVCLFNDTNANHVHLSNAVWREKLQQQLQILGKSCYKIPRILLVDAKQN